LKEDICDRLLHDVDVDASDVTVEVKAGKVTLEGTVPARYMKHTVEDIDDDCYGVKEVDNKVRVSNGSSDSQSSTSTTEAAAGRVK
jgi:osmotically-inducible protein OsmY